MDIRQCAECGKEFQPVRYNQVSCSKECRRVRNLKCMKKYYIEHRKGTERKFHWENEHNEIMKNLLNDGTSAEQIANAIGCSIATIYQQRRKLIDAGEISEKVLKRINILKSWTVKEEIELEALYYGGKSRKEIAKALDRTYNSINCRISLLGLNNDDDE